MSDTHDPFLVIQLYKWLPDFHDEIRHQHDKKYFADKFARGDRGWSHFLEILQSSRKLESLPPSVEYSRISIRVSSMKLRRRERRSR